MNYLKGKAPRWSSYVLWTNPCNILHRINKYKPIDQSFGNGFWYRGYYQDKDWMSKIIYLLCIHKAFYQRGYLHPQIFRGLLDIGEFTIFLTLYNSSDCSKTVWEKNLKHLAILKTMTHLLHRCGYSQIHKKNTL